MNRPLSVCCCSHTPNAAVKSLANRWEHLSDQLSLNFTMRNELALIRPVALYLCRKAAARGLCSSHEEGAAIAIQEALFNALYHGNLELSTDELRRERHALLVGGPTTRVLERQKMLPFMQRLIHVSAHLTSTEAKFVIRDEGPGFDYVVCTPLVIDDGEPSRPQGQGLPRMLSLMDEVRFNRAGNQVTLVLRRTTKAHKTLRRVA
jgi:anti-sigma regulatory factor (Ser/Thr protein kinase)